MRPVLQRVCVGAQYSVQQAGFTGGPAWQGWVTAVGAVG